ncbi:kinase-like domain-containing protein [Mycena floridula]|nr:kinase-like domain-containing protein [Mycena floridula]
MQLSKDHETLLDLDLEPPSDEYHGEYERSPPEFVWVNLQVELEEAGYRLRPRYHRDWKPSWLPGERLAGQPSNDCEDGLSICPLYWAAIDAIRLKDGQKVVLKITFDYTKEQEILQTFSEPPFRNNPQNHCVPVLDTIEFPRKRFKIVVLPFLMSVFGRPHCMHEVIDFMRQILQGLEFMHDYNIAHRDISALNIMMTSSHIPSERLRHFSSDLDEYSLESGLLAPGEPRQHPCQVSRLRYFFIDFGLSDEYSDGQEQARTTGIVGQIKATPELSDDVPYNPFKSDIVQLGTVFKNLFPLRSPDLHDFDVLMDRMTETKWEDRPGAKEALELFEDIVSSMPAERQTALITRRLPQRKKTITPTRP